MCVNVCACMYISCLFLLKTEKGSVWIEQVHIIYINTQEHPSFWLHIFWIKLVEYIEWGGLLLYLDFVTWESLILFCFLLYCFLLCLSIMESWLPEQLQMDQNSGAMLKSDQVRNIHEYIYVYIVCMYVCKLISIIVVFGIWL